MLPRTIANAVGAAIGSLGKVKEAGGPGGLLGGDTTTSPAAAPHTGQMIMGNVFLGGDGLASGLTSGGTGAFGGGGGDGEGSPADSLFGGDHGRTGPTW